MDVYALISHDSRLLTCIIIITKNLVYVVYYCASLNAYLYYMYIQGSYIHKLYEFVKYTENMPCELYINGCLHDKFAYWLCIKMELRVDNVSHAAHVVLKALQGEDEMQKIIFAGKIVLDRRRETVK